MSEEKEEINIEAIKHFLENIKLKKFTLYLLVALLCLGLGFWFGSSYTTVICNNFWKERIKDCICNIMP